MDHHVFVVVDRDHHLIDVFVLEEKDHHHHLFVEFFVVVEMNQDHHFFPIVVYQDQDHYRQKHLLFDEKILLVLAEVQCYQVQVLLQKQVFASVSYL
jgi:hypothetical protein